MFPQVNDMRVSAGKRHRRPAVTLQEMIAVTAIIGLAAAASFGTFGLNTLANVGADGYARRLACDLQQARRRTIATGDNHYLLCTLAGPNVAYYQLWRRASGGDVAVDQVVEAPDDVAVVVTHTTMEFDFSGAALAAYQVTATGPQRTVQLTVAMPTGYVSLTDSGP